MFGLSGFLLLIVAFYAVRGWSSQTSPMIWVALAVLGLSAVALLLFYASHRRLLQPKFTPDEIESVMSDLAVKKANEQGLAFFTPERLRDLKKDGHRGEGILTIDSFIE